jgi:hypothetical protein
MRVDNSAGNKGTSGMDKSGSVIDRMNMTVYHHSNMHCGSFCGIDETLRANFQNV